MKLSISKQKLSTALTSLGKVSSMMTPVPEHRCIRMTARNRKVSLTGCDSEQSIELTIDTDTADGMDFMIAYSELKQSIKGGKSGLLVFEQSSKTSAVTISEEVRGFVTQRAFTKYDVADCKPAVIPPADTKSVALSEHFVTMLHHASQIINRYDMRRQLQGISLSKDGITTTNGKELLNIPVDWTLTADVILPFPLALLSAKPDGKGTLTIWKESEKSEANFFRIEYPFCTWTGKLVPGRYPDWKHVLPDRKQLDYSFKLTVESAEQVREFLKRVLDHEPYNAIEIVCNEDNTVRFSSVDYPDSFVNAKGSASGDFQKAKLTLNKRYLLRLLDQGHREIFASSKEMIPIMANGGVGNYIAMPTFMPKESSAEPAKNTNEHTATNTQNTMNKEEKEMSTANAANPANPIQNRENGAVQTAVTTVAEVSPIDTLNVEMDDFRSKLKGLLDEANTLSRRIKEVALAQKQKEREVIQARRAIERIKAVSGF